MTEENEQNCNYVTASLVEKSCYVRVCDLADAAGARQLTGEVEVSLLLPKFVGEHEGEEGDILVYSIESWNNRGFGGGEDEGAWLSRAELLDLYEQLGRIVEPDYEERVMKRHRRTP